MAQKIKLTRPELKRRRDRLARFERYLPMLKLKQQQLQMTLREVGAQVRRAQQARDEVAAKLSRYRSVLADRAGIPLEQWSRPERVRTSHRNIAGVEVPVFEDVEFPAARYSLFGTPAWVDQALADLRQQSRRQAEYDVVRQVEALLQGELARVIQRVNLFEKS
jgi:V/A-type H+/Na+-transporting ATPase subunit D